MLDNFDISYFEVSALTVLGAATLIGYYFGIGARYVRLPSLIGYMVLGILLGPSILNLLHGERLKDLSFITEIALGFVAFSIGAELSLAGLRRLGPGIISIIFAESFAAFFAVLALVYLLTRDLPMSLIFASMAPASAPAGTVAVIQEYRAKGNLTQALYAVVGFDDGLAIIIFGFASALATSLLVSEATGTAGAILPALKEPALEVVFSMLLGGVAGFGFCQLVRRVTASRDVLIMVFGTVLIVTGLSLRWHLSLILTNMVVGFMMVNTQRETQVRRVTEPLLEVMPLLFILFFCLAGAHLELAALPALGTLGVVYIIGRSSGLILGARLGGMLGRVDPTVKKYVGLGILSQAGVAIGLSLIVNHEFSQLHLRHGIEEPIEHAVMIGGTVLTSITATCIFFEIVGPILTKVALTKAGEIPAEKKDKPVPATR